MAEEASRIGLKYGKGDKFRIGFHKPPFYSIKHLHLHVCVEPIKGCFNSIVKYGWVMKDINDIIKNFDKL